MAILKDDAKRLILAEWDVWSPGHTSGKPTGRDAFAFYAHLERHHPAWLTFRCRGDRWQVVHSWLIYASKVTG